MVQRETGQNYEIYKRKQKQYVAKRKGKTMKMRGNEQSEK